MFSRFGDRVLSMQSLGIIGRRYRGHCDPSTVGANFGFAIAHTEENPDGPIPYVVFDVLHAWSPQDFPDRRIDYLVIEDKLKDYITRFALEELTFDQFQSAGAIQRLQQWAQTNTPWRVVIFERTAT